MSESEDQAPKPPKPMKRTSAVPLKKETVRVTLKATGSVEESAADAEAAAAQPAPPAAPTPPTPPKPPGAAGSPPPAPTIPLRPSAPGAPKPPAPAPTIRLNTPGAPTAPKTAALQTQPLAPGARPGSQPLPKATVQLGGATQALGAPTGASKPTLTPSFASVDEDEDEGDDKIPNILSLVAFLGSLAVLVLEILTVSLWDGWGQLF